MKYLADREQVVIFQDRISGLFFVGILIAWVLEYYRTQKAEHLMYLFVYILIYNIVNVIERIIQFSGYDIFMNISSSAEFTNLQKEEHQKKCKLIVRILAGSKILVSILTIIWGRV